MPAPQKIKPHHLLDLIRDLGSGRKHTPHPYGHDVHRLAALIAARPDIRFCLTEEYDAICIPCSKLKGGLCTDTTDTAGFLTTKDSYNRAIDKRLYQRLGLIEGQVVSVAEFCEVVRGKLGDINSIYLEADPEQTKIRAKNIGRGLQIMQSTADK
jgi:hypothetical protein